MRLPVTLLVLVVALPACMTPPPQNLAPDPPTFQKATAAADGTRVTWRNATDDDFDATVVVRYLDLPDGKPAGKSLPKLGGSWGSGSVIYVGSGQSTTDSMLPEACDRLTYELWSHDSVGHWSGGGVQAISQPGARPVPSMPPAALAATLVGMNVQLSWMPAAGSTKTRLVRTLGIPAAAPDQGIVVYDGAELVATEPSSGLPLGQTLFYAAFGCNDCGACSSLAASTTILVAREDAGTPDAGVDDPDGGNPLQPRALQAQLSTDGQTVNLSWMNPPMTTGFTQAKVVRTLNALPSGPDDPAATVVFQGLGTSASERLDKLLPSHSGTVRTYFYVAFGCANAACESRGARTTFSATVSQALRGGGYTIIWRHASASTCGDRTDLGGCSCTNGVCTACPSNNWWKSCDTNCVAATARQLTPPTSTSETTTIHDQFVAKGITVGRVLSSEMCRGWQTAEGFRFGPSIEIREDLTYFVYDEANRCKNIYRLLNEVPAPGTVTTMVSHAGFSCPTMDSLAWAQAAIFKARGGTVCPETRSCPLGNECAASEACHPRTRMCTPTDCVPLLIASPTYSQWSTLP